MRTRSIISMLRRLLFRRVLVAIDGVRAGLLFCRHPNDLVIVQHKEQVMFTNPNTGKYQLSREHRNVYHHARVNCIRQKFPSFTPIQHCRINRDTFTMFTKVHKDFIAMEIGLRAAVV